jgi:hypothetical protein
MSCEGCVSKSKGREPAPAYDTLLADTLARELDAGVLRLWRNW